MITVYTFDKIISNAQNIYLDDVIAISIDDINELIKNQEFFKILTELGHLAYIYTPSYEVALLAERLVPNKKDIKVTLIDDFQNKDRSYINLNEFRNLTLVIPIAYATWGVKFTDEMEVYSIIKKIDDFLIGLKSNKVCSKITHHNLNEIERIACVIANTPNLTELERLIVIANYIQEHCQFVEGPETEGPEGIFVVENPPEDIKAKACLFESVLFHGFGLCASIAEAMTLLCNNPFVNLNARNVYTNNHLFNTIQINGSYYYLDNTFNIACGNTLPHAIKLKEFCSNYLLFGTETVDTLHHSVNSFLAFKIEKRDFPREYLKANAEYLEDCGLIRLNYAPQVAFKSYKKVV